MGLPPLFTSLTMLVFSPMAPIAITIKNLLSSFNGWVISAGSWNTVVTTEASTQRKARKRENLLKLIFTPPWLLAWRVRTKASTSVMGIMARVRVSFTMVAVSSVLGHGCHPRGGRRRNRGGIVDGGSGKQAEPLVGQARRPPRVGKTSAAIILNRKITEIDWATSSSSASMTGAVAAIADPPQIEEPTPIRIALFFAAEAPYT